MIRLIRKYRVLEDGYAWNLLMDEQNKTMVFSHGRLLFVFNWHPTASIPDYELPVQGPGKYVPILSTDEAPFSAARSARRWTPSTSRSMSRTAKGTNTRASGSTTPRGRRPSTCASADRRTGWRHRPRNHTENSGNGQTVAGVFVSLLQPHSIAAAAGRIATAKIAATGGPSLRAAALHRLDAGNRPGHTAVKLLQIEAGMRRSSTTMRPSTITVSTSAALPQ